MQYEDRITIATPEGLDVELTLAGVGSRFFSAIVDVVIEGAVIGALLIALLNLTSDAVAAAVTALATFSVIFGYHVLFETLASGRSPGKRAAGLRVVQVGGAPVRFKDSAIRNIVRLIDILPPITYALGAATILITKRNQRLGDLAAGTIVVRVAPSRAVAATAPAAAEWPGVERWDVSAVTPDELVAVRRFLDRREGLSPAARRGLAGDLAARLRPKVAGATAEGDEGFLEGLAAAKAARG